MIPPTAVLEYQVVVKAGGVRFDASKSKDIDGDPCISFLFFFGDSESGALIDSPRITRTYAKSGIYSASVTVGDKYGGKSTAIVTVKINKTSNAESFMSSEPDSDSLLKRIKKLEDENRELSTNNKRLINLYQQMTQNDPAIYPYHVQNTFGQSQQI